MSEFVSEREMSIESLPLGASRREWAELEDRVLGRTPDCPALVQLIRLRRDLLSPEDAGEVRRHAAECSYCGPWVRGFECPDDDPWLASLHRFQALPDEPPVAEDPKPTTPLDAPAYSFEDWSVPGYSASYASVFRYIKHPRQLLDALRPVLPELLADVGLSRDLADAFESFALDKDEQEWQEASAWLPRTLERFARKRLGLTALPCVLDQEGWKGVFTRCTLRYLALNPLMTHEADRAVAGSFYASLLAQGVVDLSQFAPGLQEQYRLAAVSAGIGEVEGRQLLAKGRNVKRSLVACSLRPAQKR